MNRNNHLKKLCLLAVSALMLFPDCASLSAEESGSLQKFNESLIQITKKTVPMVVNISAIKVMPKSPYPGFDMYRRKGYPFRGPVKPEAQGSGVIIDKRGYIVTNNHVVRNTRLLKVTLSDKREFRCKIVGSDPATDIAIIKIEGKVPEDLPVIKLGDSDKLKVGEIVIAIGNPFGFSHTVTMGIVSATGRQDVGLADYENFIQTDAAINPGNSGGALINIKGELVGINTAIYSKSGGFMGIGFAIPSSMIKSVVDELIRTGKVVRGWLGVYIQNVAKEMAKSFNFEREGGVLISDIIKSSPAEGTGIKVGDIIVAIDSRAIKDVNHLRRAVSAKKPGSMVKVTVFRNGGTLDIPVKVGVLPDKLTLVKKEAPGKEDLLGLMVSDLNEELAYRYKLQDRHGVVISGVKNGSPAFQSGLQAGDLIKEVDRKPVDNTKTYHEVVQRVKSYSSVLFLIRRGGVNKFIVVVLKPE